MKTGRVAVRDFLAFVRRWFLWKSEEIKDGRISGAED